MTRIAPSTTACRARLNPTKGRPSCTCTTRASSRTRSCEASTDSTLNSYARQASSSTQPRTAVAGRAGGGDAVFVPVDISDPDSTLALAAATVGIAMGTASDVTSEAAGAVVMDTALERVDELFHIGKRLRSIALQSAVGGMAASLVGMGLAAAGLLSPAVGALMQEAIDVLAVLNALRVSWNPGPLSDYGGRD